MRFITVVYMFSFGFVALAQDNKGIASKVEAVKYPALSRQARIQGDVRLRLGPKGVTLISGHPLLAPVVVENLKDLGNLSETDIDVVYHFILVEPDFRITRTKVKKGDAFDRLILRALRIKTEKVIEESECIEKKANLAKNRIDLTKNLWRFGSTVRPAACKQKRAISQRVDRSICARPKGTALFIFPTSFGQRPVQV
jgi:hypothetical protein